jgi:yecA family protein
MSENFDDALFDAVDGALNLMDCDIGAAECHGILCGMTCGVQHVDPSAWLGHVTGYHEYIGLDDLGSGHALIQLLDGTKSGFTADDFSLQMLLPSDDTELAQRTIALSAWCRGFLSGFGLTEMADIRELSDDCQGYLRDLQEIGRVDSQSSDDNDDERALLEICEYVRMGAMLLREEALFSDSAQSDSETIH